MDATRWLSCWPVQKRYPCTVLTRMAWSLMATVEYSPMSSVLNLYGGPALVAGDDESGLGVLATTACPVVVAAEAASPLPTPTVAPAMLTAARTVVAFPTVRRSTASSLSCRSSIGLRAPL